MNAAIEVKRPERWDHPLDPSLSDAVIQQLLATAPFVAMDPRRFHHSASLTDILRNDTRVLQLDPGDVVFREGQYGGCAYLVLDGQVRVLLQKMHSKSEPKRGLHRLSMEWIRSGLHCLSMKRPDRRRQPRKLAARAIHFARRGQGDDARLFLQDVPRILDENASTVVAAGEMFGELAAVTRSPREFTVVAEVKTQVLEIRWQGLRLLKQDPQFRQLLDERYRSEVLSTHLRETPLLRYLPNDDLAHLVAAAQFESFGNLEWYAEYRRGMDRAPATQIAREPLIAEEGSYAVGLWIVRSGFARLSRRQGAGHRTLAYLGKGQLFGLRELVHNYRLEPGTTPLPYQESLRAIGYVDAVCIPKQAVYDHVLPYIRRVDLPQPIRSPRYQFGQPVLDATLIGDADGQIETGLLEFLVEKRLINGRQAMVIDTERCTRCDDCVRACAVTHGGQPLFERRGVQYGPWLVAQACMHCEDPVCMIGCPTAAIHRDTDAGTISINAQTCIGCKSCAESCPYDNIRMVTSVDTMGRTRIDQDNGLPILQATKCDLCSSAPHGPACQTACPHDALVRINLGDLNQVSRWMQRKAA